jgi:membrane protease YdiL (CAAX protease family)
VSQVSKEAKLASEELSRPICGLTVILVYLIAQQLVTMLLLWPYCFVVLRLIFLTVLLIVLKRKEFALDFAGMFGKLGINFLKDGGFIVCMVLAIIVGRLAVHQFLFPNLQPLSLSVFRIFDESLLPALNEEPVCRGLFLSILLKNFGAKVAILISTLIFVSIHRFFGFPIVISLLILGTLLGIAFAKTKSLSLCITLHAIWNMGIFVPKI